MRTQKDIGQELERELDANGWSERALALEEEFWKAVKR